MNTFLIGLPETEVVPLDGLVRRSFELKRAATGVAKSRNWHLLARIELCRKLIARDQDLSPAINSFFHGLLDSERYYWISSLYTLLMPSSRRKRLATYFTPPHLCEQVIDRLVEQGLDLEHHTVLDPAAGGAAFLVPLARRIQTIARARNSASADMISDIESRLSGIDVEPGLTELSHMLLSDLLGEELKALGRPLKQIIQRQNTLRSPADKLVDVVISNPPYGRIMRPSPRTLDRWKDVICEGHANLYALFIGAALERTKVGGLIGLIIPTSFLAGPYFRSLRNHIRSQATILSVDLIERRSDVFVDVIQDTCVVILRKTKESTNNRSKGTPSVGTIGADGCRTEVGALSVPHNADGVWVLPSQSKAGLNFDFFDPRFSRLSSYGYILRAGYFVWNRSRTQLRNDEEPRPDEIPLLWAHSVKADKTVVPSSGPKRSNDSSLKSFVTINPGSTAIIRGQSIVLQRTTNRNQPKRLVGGLVSRDFADRNPTGYVTENHTIVVLPDPQQKQAVAIETLLELLTSSIVDDCFRRVSGTVSVSTKVLRELPLPNPEALAAGFQAFSSPEEAIRYAYLETIGRREP